MPRLIAFLSFSFTVSYYGLWLTDGVITPFYAEILSAFPTVATIFGALSFALYSYLDGIAKDLPPSQEGRDHRKYVEAVDAIGSLRGERSEEHTSELQSLMRTSYAVFCLKKK